MPTLSFKNKFRQKVGSNPFEFFWVSSVVPNKDLILNREEPWPSVAGWEENQLLKSSSAFLYILPDIWTLSVLRPATWANAPSESSIPQHDLYCQAVSYKTWPKYTFFLITAFSLVILGFVLLLMDGTCFRSTIRIQQRREINSWSCKIYGTFCRLYLTFGTWHYQGKIISKSKVMRSWEARMCFIISYKQKLKLKLILEEPSHFVVSKDLEIHLSIFVILFVIWKLQ